MKKQKQKKIEIPQKHFASDKPTFCVYEVYPKSNKTVYYLQKNTQLSSITLEGFKGLPAGLYLNRNGFGFGKKGVFLLSALKENVAENKILELIISSKSIKKITESANKVIVTLSFNDVKNLLVRLSRINEDSNSELRSAVGSFLSTKFPNRVKISTEDFDEYKGGEIAALLRRNKVSEKLSGEDLDSLSIFFPKIFQSTLKGKKKDVKQGRTKLINKTKVLTDKIFLDEVIKEFDSNLKKKSFSENDWQKFLSEKVLRFMANYVTSIEKENVSVDVSYPDFVLVDVYSFVDVFEIKKPNTPLLALDEDHDNYYWRIDVSKAIAQIENYTDEITRNSSDYIRKVKRKKGIDIKVVRPRGYIIAGSSKQFGNQKEAEDFRKLGSSLRNISFILYDELFENLKNLRSKL